MWSMFDLTPDWSQDEDDDMEDDVEDGVHVGDIIAIATRSKKPVLNASVNFDDSVELRVLGEAKGDRTLYLCLVTAGDAEHVTPTVTIGKSHAFDYKTDEFYHGCDGIIVSELHVRRIAKKQRGHFCAKCTEYNEDARPSGPEPYLCLTCRENPWR